MWLKKPIAEATSLTEKSTFAALIKTTFSASGSGVSSIAQVESGVESGVDGWVMTDRFGGDAARLVVAKDTKLPLRIVIGSALDLSFDQWNAV